jgi:membrane protease YdiL (CAAX protease family)
MQPSSFRRRLLWIVWAVSALVCVGLFFIPAFIIRPFRHQSAAALNLAMALRQRAPMGTLAAAIICLALAIFLWYASDKWRKGVLALVMVLVAFSAVMARLNYFEWMFHPVPSPLFEAESDSKLDKGEMILAIQFGPDARAYPIREMAYHHIVNDTVEGVPVAVTY